MNAERTRLLDLCAMGALPDDVTLQARDRELLTLARQHVPGLVKRVRLLEDVLDKVASADEDDSIDLSVDLHREVHAALGGGQ